jgi:DNA polymerase-3 subunit delta'
MVDDADDASPRPAWQDLYPWQRAPAREALARRASWPQGLLVTGPRGIGKRVLALNLARALLCETPRPDGSACGTCASCGYVAAGQHPDLSLVEPFRIEDDGEVKRLDSIPIEQVRMLTDWSELTSHRGVAKVAVIAPADLLNVYAANALLKTLEEPPPATSFLLVTHQPGRVPPTIRSRCLRLSAPRPSSEEAAAWLAQQGVADAANVLAQADGAPLLALALADPSWQQERSVWLSALAKPASLPAVALAARVETGPRDERKDRLALVIDWLLAWTADLARVVAGGRARRNPDFGDALVPLAASVAPVALFRYHALLADQRALVVHPLSPRLVAEMLLFQYRDLFR